MPCLPKRHLICSRTGASALCLLLEHAANLKLIDSTAGRGTGLAKEVNAIVRQSQPQRQALWMFEACVQWCCYTRRRSEGRLNCAAYCGKHGHNQSELVICRAEQGAIDDHAGRASGSGRSPLSLLFGEPFFFTGTVAKRPHEQHTHRDVSD